jgi:hypothetical protein
VGAAKVDSSAEARTPDQIIAEDRNLLFGYLNAGASDSPERWHGRSSGACDKDCRQIAREAEQRRNQVTDKR